METVWKKIVIDITVLFTMVFIVSCIVFMLNGSIPVWADTKTGDVYKIPEDYQSRNFVVQWRRIIDGKKTGTETDSNFVYKYQNILDYYLDFTVYYPQNYNCTFWISSNPDFEIALSHVDSIDTIYECLLSNCIDYSYDNVYVIKLKGNYKDDVYMGDITIYIKLNNANISTLYRDDIGVSTQSDKSCNIVDMKFYDSNLVNLSVNYPFVKYNNSNCLIYSGIYDNSHVVQQLNGSSSDRHVFLSNLVSAIRCVEKRIKNDSNGSFPEPTLNKVNKISDTTLHCFYEYPSQGRTPNFNYVYPKIYVKVNGKDWVEYKEEDKSAKGFEHVFKFHVDNKNQSIWGALSLINLYIRMGYTYSEITAEDFEPPKIEGIIWGVQYGYALTQNILDESSIRKSKIVFSRYVFEDNIVDTPDVGIGDLGDLPNISGSTSNIEVGTNGSGTSGGSTNRPGQGQNVSDKDSTSFIDMIINGKLNFSSVGDALFSLFSMVSGFASAVGSILSAVFGNAFGMIALCAVGAVIVLRVLGR